MIFNVEKRLIVLFILVLSAICSPTVSAQDKRSRTTSTASETDPRREPQHQDHHDRECRNAHAEREGELLDYLLLLPAGLRDRVTRTACCVEGGTDTRSDEHNAAEVVTRLGHGLAKSRSGVFQLRAVVRQLGDEQVDRDPQPDPPRDEREGDDVSEGLARSVGPEV